METLRAGREMDVLVAQAMGDDLIPPRELAMARVAQRRVVSTGPAFVLQDGEMVAMPCGEVLKQPEGSDDWNDRYFLHVAKVLGAKLRAEVDAYRLTPPPYSADLHAAWQVVSFMQCKGSAVSVNWGEDTHAWECSWITGGERYTGTGGTAEVAVCRALLKGAGLA